MEIIAFIVAWLTSTFFGVKSPLSLNLANTPAPTQAISVVAEDLDTPWEIAWLENGDMLVTERPGRLVRISDNKVFTIAGVKETGEGGLLGLAVQEPFIYLYRTTPQNTNQVVRFKLLGDELTDEQVLLDAIPAGQNHDGGRLKFGPDGKLYLTTGETGDPALAQNQKSLAGKVLRMNPDGSALEIYSYGHRNSEGLAWDAGGQLWSTEHGRSGALSGYDELNLIHQGGNYGWPSIQGDEMQTGMETPVLNSGASTTWAPGGIAFLDGSLFFTGLRGATLYEYVITTKELKTHLVQMYGRLRAVGVGPDNMLYVSTSNRDGRGVPKSGDDHILRINPQSLP